MTTHITAFPAYGRRYDNQKAVKADWAAGKDFASYPEGGRYLNNATAAEHNLKVVVSFTNRSGGFSYAAVN